MASRSFVQFGVLGFYTETSLHCGAESGTGYVDMPIQRECHTHYPIIQGSSVKGILRDELKDMESISVEKLFGSEDAQTPGTVSFGDGILVAFPIRSSGAPFHWVTCPFVLERVFRLLGAGSVEIAEPDQGKAWAKDEGEVLLEEMRVEKKVHAELFGKGPESLPNRLLELIPNGDRGFGYTRKLFPKRLLVVRDEDFRELVEIGTEVVTRIKLNGLGTTARLSADEAPEGFSKYDLEGNLFVQELVPPETLFACPLRAPGVPAELVGAFAERPIVRIGGDETIGRGVTHLTYLDRTRQGG